MKVDFVQTDVQCLVDSAYSIYLLCGGRTRSIHEDKQNALSIITNEERNSVGEKLRLDYVSVWFYKDSCD